MIPLYSQGSRAQARITVWFGTRQESLQLEPLTELRLRVAAGRVRIPDVPVSAVPVPEEEIFTSPPYLCVEVMSPDDTMAGMQDRVDDYLHLGVPNVWVIDPWKHRGWRVTAETDGIMRTGEFARIENYIVRNPVRAGLAARPELYRWSSAWLAEAD